MEQSSNRERQVNFAAASPLWLVGILALALATAAIEDAWRLRISNIVSVVVLLGAVLAAGLQGFDVSLWQNITVFALLLMLGTAAFGAKLLGGGDVKLFAVTGLWFDIRSAIWLVAIVFLTGGLLGIGYLAARLFKGKGVGRRNAARVPYGIAISVGALVLIALNRWDT